MSLNQTPSSERLHIVFFGLRNAGKSSLVNAVTNQKMAVVSDVKGTTTDPVKKSMELLPLGPVVIIDTPGLDDEGELGRLRVERAYETLAGTDIAVVVTDASQKMTPQEEKLIGELDSRRLPYIIAYSKSDLTEKRKTLNENEIYVSAKSGEGIEALKSKIGALKDVKNERRIISDLISEGDVVVLVIPIDESAPKGRLILPQQLVMRDILDAHGIFVSCRPEELKRTLSAMKEPPALVITDSQAFGSVSSDVPKGIALTSFSILMARYKGDLDVLLRGTETLKDLHDGDRVLICEGCTHHRQCNDIGSVKLPGWIDKYSGARPEYEFTSGAGFPKELSDYKLIVHCGGCMLNEKEMRRRMEEAERAGVPAVNYGMAIAEMNGILDRSMEPFK